SRCQQGQLRSATHLEVLGVHVQLVAVQLAQLGEGLLDVVQVLDGISEGGEHLLAVRLDLGIAADGGGIGEVPEVCEEPLGPGVDDQEAGLSSSGTNINLAPQVADELLLLGGPVHHG
uniref:Uncharacterized protein n=1 Tax=Varanus komodoensis TaxID=61221 RepID=A0A8D2LC51_VARKO